MRSRHPIFGHKGHSIINISLPIKFGFPFVEAIIKASKKNFTAQTARKQLPQRIFLEFMAICIFKCICQFSILLLSIMLNLFCKLMCMLMYGISSILFSETSKICFALVRRSQVFYAG